MLIFRPAIVLGGNLIERMAVPMLTEFGFVYYRFYVACMNELWNVVSRREANMNGVFCPGASIIIFQSLS